MRNAIFTILIFCGFIFVSAQNIQFADVNLKNKLLLSSPNNIIATNTSGNYFAVDANNDGEISVEEALMVGKLKIDNSQILTLNDLQHFQNLTEVSASINSISNLQLAGLSSLKVLDCSWCNINTANLNGAPNLVSLKIKNNSLTELDLSTNTKLEMLDIGTNFLNTLNIQNNVELKYFIAPYTMISELDFSNNHQLISVVADNGELQNVIFGTDYPFMKTLNISFNFVENINLSGLQALEKALLSYNTLSVVDISKNQLVSELTVTGNVLEYLNLKNGHNITEGPLNFINYQDNQNLQVICADEDEIAGIVQLNSNYGYSGVVVTSYCSFTPGGEYSVISGRAIYDDEMNGCTPDDAGVKFTELKISDGGTDNFYYTDIEGKFEVPVTNGTYTVTPSFNHPYYTVTPQSFTVSFPQEQSPFQQNFCFAPIGNVSDLKVTLVSEGQPVPGKNDRYHLYLENQGVNTVSGVLQLEYEGEFVDLHVSNPVYDSFELGTVKWNFTDLKAFETRHYDMVFSFNGEETPEGQLFPGDLITFTATAPVSDDQTPADNTFVLVQEVLAERPSQYTACLEGSSVSSAYIGKEVHYQIAFKNTGSSTVHNLVVKNFIDAAKLDLGSFSPLYSSHAFRSRIVNGNEVEFIFENINLPVNEEGFVSFKIKTKPTLQIGDSFQNHAAVYLDFNQQPIATNTFITTIAQLGTENTQLHREQLMLYPNPVAEVLYLQSNGSVEAVEIFNSAGQMVLKSDRLNLSKEVNVQKLSPGIYYLKAKTDQEVLHSKFIKK